jgi:Tol biopolymer transport system component
MRIFSRVKRLATGKSMLLVASTALAVVLASCAEQKGGTAPTKPASTSHNGKIAFVRLDNRVGEFDIFVVEPDGTGLRKLTTKPVLATSPDWSPNGKRLAFDRLTKTSGGIYTVNSEGGGLRKLTDPPEGFWDSEPSWSPDGTKIAFTRTSGKGPGRPDVFTMNADGTHMRKLTGKTEGAYSPDFSPDGKRIVFIGWEGGNKLAVMNADGTNVRRLTPDSKGIDEDSPDWWPLPSS